jgi:hypothetical protein
MNTKASVTNTNVYEPMGREAILSDSRNSGLHDDITTCTFILFNQIINTSIRYTDSCFLFYTYLFMSGGRKTKALTQSCSRLKKFEKH